jgi:uncharacterized membrane protein
MRTSIPFDAPWAWLAAGWRDLWRIPLVSLSYGAGFTAAVVGVLAALAIFEAHSLFPAVAGGYLIIAPFLGVGLYEASRRLVAGEAVTLSGIVRTRLASPGQLAFFGLLLLLVFLVWLRIAFLLMMLFLGTATPPAIEQFVHDMLLTVPGLSLLVVGSAVGASLSGLVFAMSALAVPMLMVERVDALTAAGRSIATVMANPKPMALWAALIAAMMACAFATMLVGLVIVFPLIAHATWHAYVEATTPRSDAGSGGQSR